MADPKPLTLTTLAEGAADELFGDALKKVIENIRDPNTDWKGKRTITLQVAFSTDEERRLGEVEVKCSTKIPGVKSVLAHVVYGQHLGVPMAVEQPGQPSLFTQPSGGPRPIAAPAGAGD